MATEQIKINIDAITKEALGNIKKFTGDAKKSLGGIEKASKDSRSSISKINNSLSGVTNAAKIAGGALLAAFAGRALISGISDLVNEAVSFENSLIGVRSVAANFGVTASEVTSTVQELASDGLVPVQDVANSLKNLLATGLDIDQSVETFNALKDAAAFGRQGFLDLGQAIEGATQGIKNGQSTLVDNAGITKNLSVLQKEYAASIGTTIGRLTEAQKTQAIYQGILKEGAIFAGDAARLTETYTGAVARLDFSFTQLQVSLGQFISRSPQIRTIVQSIAIAFDQFRVFVEQNNEQIGKQFKNAIVLLVDATGIGISALDTLLKSFEAIPKIIKFSFFGIGALVLKPFQVIESAIISLLETVGLLEQPLGLISPAFKEFAGAAEDAAGEIVKITSQESLLSGAAEGLAGISVNLSDLEPKSNIDSLNKQVKEIADSGNEAAKGVDNLNKSSSEFIERIGSRFSTLSASIEQSLAKLGQSASSALDGLFGTGTAKQKAEFDQIANDLEKAFKNKDISKEIYDAKKSDLKDLRDKLEKNTTLAFGTGLLNSFAKGAEGAKDLAIGAAQAGLDVLVPGLGQALGPVLDLLTKSPEEVKQQINAFAETLPVIVENIILNIPVLFEAIADKSDVIIERLAENSDKIIIALVRATPRVASKLAASVAIEVPIALAKALPQALINIFKEVAGKIVAILVNPLKNAAKSAFNFIKSAGKEFFNFVKDAGVDFVKRIVQGAIDFVRKLIENIPGVGGLTDAVNNPGDFIGDLVSDPIGSIGRTFGVDFAEGGQGFVKSVPGGFPSDTFPARLTSGELVVDRSTAFKLKDFLDNQGSNNQQQVTNALLSDLVRLMSGEKVINTSVQLNEEAFADIVLELNRSNARLA